MSSAPTSGSTPPATGGNNTNNNNGGRRGYQGNRNNNNTNNASKAKRNQFKGAAGADTALYEKTVTVGHNQATQIVDVLEALITYCAAKGYSRWAESITDLTRLERADFIGTPPSQRTYGTVTNNVFAYNGTGEEEYRIAYDMWKAEYTHTLKAFLEYEKNATHIFITIKGHNSRRELIKIAHQFLISHNHLDLLNLRRIYVGILFQPSNVNHDNGI